MTSWAVRKGKGTHSQASRCLRILNRLRGYREGVFVRDLASELEVHEDQIYKDMNALELGGNPVDYDTRPGTGPSGKVRNLAVVILRGDTHRQITLTREQRYTMLAARRAFDVFKGTSFYKDIDAVFEKLMQGVPKADRDELASWGERFVYVPDGGTKNYSDKGEVLDALRNAVLSRRVVRYTYAPASGREERGLLAPYAMVIYRQGLYVVGRRLSRLDDATRPPSSGNAPTPPLAVERFTTVEVVSARRSYEVPSDLNLDRMFQGAFGMFIGGGGEPQRVVIEFSRAKRAHVLGRTWHATQKVEALPDGRVRLEFMLNDIVEVVSWVMSWGPHARVLEPVQLFERVAREHADAAEWYASRRAAVREQAEVEGSTAAGEPRAA